LEFPVALIAIGVGAWMLSTTPKFVPYSSFHLSAVKPKPKLPCALRPITSKAYNTTNQSEHKANGNGKMHDLIEKFLIE